MGVVARVGQEMQGKTRGDGRESGATRHRGTTQWPIKNYWSR
jgi:hypothetical protein